MIIGILSQVLWNLTYLGGIFYFWAASLSLLPPFLSRKWRNYITPNKLFKSKEKLTLSLTTLKIKIILLFWLTIGATITTNLYVLHYQSQHPYHYFININDADRLSNNNTILRIGQLQTAMLANAKKKDRFDAFSAIIEIDSTGEVVWDFTPNASTTHIDHELVKREGGYFFCDSLADSVKFVNATTKEIQWEFALGDINWTKLNPDWGADHYYNSYCRDRGECIDWSHMNDIDFKNYGTWEAMLVSIRNFNLIIEVNYSRARNKPIASAEDITWYYQGVLAHQHNPDYLPNGNLLIVNSDLQTFIEVNMTTKHVVWEFTHPDIKWPRDIDLMPNGNYLITDIDQIHILNRTIDEIIFSYGPFFGGYEADFLEESNSVLIAAGTSGKLYEVDLDSGELIWEWGTDVLTILLRSNLIVSIVFWMGLLFLLFQGLIGNDP